jgi:aminoglycoside phosphotransferase (APT) family kinase protein
LSGPKKMHPDEIDISVDLVHCLIEAQAPDFADLPVRPVTPFGTVNAMFRLGDELAVRLPRVPWGKQDVEDELTWLPQLAAHLPVAVPLPVVTGRPSPEYPWTWSINRWLDGENPRAGALTAPELLAGDLAEFILALRRIELPNGPSAYRGGPLEARDDQTRAAIGQLDGLVDTGAIRAVWDAALLGPSWDGPNVWLHADLMPGNLLVRDGRLSGVIDFPTAGVGDPATDLIVAWNLLPAEVRPGFRAALHVDDATWLRGRAKALSIAVIALPYYLHINPLMADNARYTIGEVLADYRHNATNPT